MGFILSKFNQQQSKNVDFEYEEQPGKTFKETTIDDSKMEKEQLTEESCSLYTPPSWITETWFNEVLTENVAEFEKVLNLNIEPAIAAGENFASTMWRVKIEIQLKDKSTQIISTILKHPVASPEVRGFFAILNMFEKEKLMYDEIIKDLEEIYQQHGVNIKFGPKSYKITNAEDEVILMEDLKLQNFKNADRLKGFDIKQTELVLKKLAQFHAASVKRVQQKGKFVEIFNAGLYSEKSRVMFEMNKLFAPDYLACVREYKGSEEYYDKIVTLVNEDPNRLIEITKVNDEAFNVLNHGDCWLNNIMFQHDDQGNVLETIFVDFQLCKYGSPSEDLYYVLFSSTQNGLVVQEFDYFIRYYHDNLMQSLDILKYDGPRPSLRELHEDMLQSGNQAFYVCQKTAAAIRIDPAKAPNVDKMKAQTEEGKNLRKHMYSNDNYKEFVESILPWLNRRGSLD